MLNWISKQNNPVTIYFELYFVVDDLSNLYIIEHLVVPLLPYQKQGLAWLISRESKTAKPRGGILAGKQNI